MSMIGNLSRIPEEVRVALHMNPQAISGILYPDLPEETSEKPGIFSRLFGRQKPTVESDHTSIHALAEEDTTDVDKAWHALHFLFTGSDWEGEFPQGFLVSCGEEIGDVDVGYGPARSFTPEQVKAIFQFLSALNRRELRGRLDPEKMNKMEIYPSIWKDCENPDDEWDYIEGGLDEIVRFIGEAVQQDLALLVYIN